MNCLGELQHNSDVKGFQKTCMFLLFVTGF
jgi:hypothetical protein